MISCCCSLAGTKACETCSNHQMIWKQIGYRLPKDLDKKLHTPEPHKDETMDDLISRKWLVECIEEGWIGFDTEKDYNRMIHLVRDTAPSVQIEKEVPR